MPKDTYLWSLPVYIEPSPYIKQIQKKLIDEGFNPGPIDGLRGKRTNDALKKYQLSLDIPATGELDSKTREVLITE